MLDYSNLNTIEEQHALDTEIHNVWVPQVPTTESEKIVCAVNALNRSLDKRLDRIADVLVQLTRAIERASRY
jgi:hypothetical protein